jgi:hypothetical protein
MFSGLIELNSNQKQVIIGFLIMPPKVQGYCHLFIDFTNLSMFFSKKNYDNFLSSNLNLFLEFYFFSLLVSVKSHL